LIYFLIFKGIIFKIIIMFERITSTILPDDIIDIHVHIGGPADENNELYFWSPKFEKSITYEGIKLVTRISESHLSGLRYLSVLYHQVKKSRHIDKIVLLALDQIYSPAGKALPAATHLFASNEYVAILSFMYPEFLFGCSVHPYDPHAVQRLWRCVNHGAVLCKWIPSAQAIDPTHPLSQKFYRALAALKLPLLLHVGPEEAVPTSIDERRTLLYDSAAGE
jgi:predicted TIM-barrel fold metal-dependent hydrolase